MQRAVYIINTGISEGYFRPFLRQRKDIPLIVYFILNVKRQLNHSLPDEMFWNSGAWERSREQFLNIYHWDH